MHELLSESWRNTLSSEFESEYYKKLALRVETDYLCETVYPERATIFTAFNLCSLDKTSVVILGQDPYHGPNRAHGLSFSVPSGVRIPPSLKNIYKEIEADTGIPIPDSGNLERWAKQGVLLLNATLTVEAGKAGSHQKIGWEQFTDAVIKKIADERKQVVFLLWGNYARAKRQLIDSSKHLVLEAAHPSPLSAHNGFYGCKHFSKTNTFLEQSGKGKIIW